MQDLQVQDVGRYHIIGQLGKGGMAVVYKAYDKRLEREVAIKFIHPPAIPPEFLEKLLKRFEREAKQMAQFTHPNIVTIIDYGEHEGIPYLVMPFLAGGTLKERIALLHGNGMDCHQAVRLLVPIARALEYAHARDTIHRDVKPSNILLTDKGQPMLTDFGVAKILNLEEEQTLTGTGVGIGTMKYMAPEQWKNQVTAQTDIYALGVVLFELVTGRTAYDIEIPADGLEKYLFKSLTRLGELNPILAEGLAQILLKALAKESHERYRDMSLFAEAMERLAVTDITANRKPSAVGLPEEESTLILPPGQVSAGVEQRKPKRRIGWWILAGIALLGVVGILITGNLQVTIEGNKGQGIFDLLAGMASHVTNTPEETITPQPTSTPPAGTVRLSEKDGMQMVYIPAGIFSMGSLDWSDEKPVHDVSLDGYWIDRTEVTNRMYALCIEAGGCSPPRKKGSYARSSYYGDPRFENFPVINIDWNQSQVYCAWTGGRLPTEAEWEKAGRGMDRRRYPWGEGIDCGIANFKGNDYGTLPCVGDTREVGSYLNGSSPYGVLDLTGNVSEWVQDWYAEDYYAIAPSENPSGPSTGENRVVKGGAWGNTPWDVRLSVRDYSDPNWAGNSIGFRCVQSP